METLECFKAAPTTMSVEGLLALFDWLSDDPEGNRVLHSIAVDPAVFARGVEQLGKLSASLNSHAEYFRSFEGLARDDGAIYQFARARPGHLPPAHGPYGT
jgi:hypothetical protein